MCETSSTFRNCAGPFHLSVLWSPTKLYSPVGRYMQFECQYLWKVGLKYKVEVPVWPGLHTWPWQPLHNQGDLPGCRVNSKWKKWISCLADGKLVRYRYTLLMRWDLPEGSFTSMIDKIIGYGQSRWVTSLARLKASVLNNLAKGLSGEQGNGEGGGLVNGEVALVSPHVDKNLTITSSTTRHLCCPYRSVVHLPSFPLWQLAIMFPSSLQAFSQAYLQLILLLYD